MKYINNPIVKVSREDLYKISSQMTNPDDYIKELMKKSTYMTEKFLFFDNKNYAYLHNKYKNQNTIQYKSKISKTAIKPKRKCSECSRKKK